MNVVRTRDRISQTFLKIWLFFHLKDSNWHAYTDCLQFTHYTYLSTCTRCECTLCIFIASLFCSIFFSSLLLFFFSLHLIFLFQQCSVTCCQRSFQCRLWPYENFFSPQIVYSSRTEFWMVNGFYILEYDSPI